MHRVTFYNVGDGDSSQIVLSNGRRVMMDFHHLTKSEDGKGPEIDLCKRIRDELKESERDYLDVVAFTHGDADHIQGAASFFELEHADCHRGDGRIKMREMWLPAAMVVEDGTQTQQSSDRILLRQEARYRLREGKGIKIFSKPELLKDWMLAQGIDFESRKHLFIDAGNVVPGFTLSEDGVEFFVHSPFVEHTDEGDDLRNSCALIFNVRFQVGGTLTNYLAVGDSTFEVLEQIVRITEYHGRGDRLQWDLFNIPHHCSYKALGPEKGINETIPTALIAKLLKYGSRGAYAISSSSPISNDSEAHEKKMPPHIQARRTYERYIREINGKKFLVTMEEPHAYRPQPTTFEIGEGGCILKRVSASGAAIAVSTAPPRAGGK